MLWLLDLLTSEIISADFCVNWNALVCPNNKVRSPGIQICVPSGVHAGAWAHFAECEVFPSVPCELQLFPLKSVGGLGGRKDGKACGDELF